MVNITFFFVVLTRTTQRNQNADKKRFWLGEIESIDSKIMNESVSTLGELFYKDLIQS
jgi:hypothetical protein